MKNLILTSEGITTEIIKDFFLELLEAQNIKKLCLISTERGNQDGDWIKYHAMLLRGLGLKVDIVNISKPVDAFLLYEYKAYYVCGGNTFYVLDQMRRMKVDKMLKKVISDGALYFGISAGSMLLCPDISIANYGSVDGKMTDINDIKIEDLSGFNVLPFYIFPHFRDSEKESVEKFYKDKKKPVITLTDEQAIYITDKAIRLLGDRSIFTLGEVPDIKVESKKESKSLI